MKAKTIKALDVIIAGLEELKEALESEANKSGGSADDEAAGEVSRPRKSAKAASVPASRKKQAPEPDDSDDDDLDGDAGADDADDDDEDDLPQPKAKAGVKGKPAAKKPAAKGKAKPADEDDDGADLDTVKAKLRKVMTTAGLGKPKVVAILKKFGAATASELEEDDYARVIKACDAMLASAVEDEEDEEDDE